jgi:hypothetical protein
LSRLPATVFAGLVAATVAAFFVSQHLKVADPLINGSPRPDPPAINPVAGRVCKDLAGRRVSFKRTRIGFYLQSRADTVLVDVVDTSGQYVATAGGSGRYVRPGRNRYVFFTWDGRESDGSIAPDGTYFFRVALQQEGRTFELTAQPVRVITAAPHPRVTQVSPSLVDEPGHPVSIRYTPGSYHNADIVIYRTGVTGRPVAVKTFGVNGRRGRAIWNGTIAGAPAPAGTYLVGMNVTDQACNPGRFPVVLPPAAGSTPHAGITVRYLAVQPPMVATPAGSPATVYVDSRRRPYTWALRRPGENRVLERGSVGPALADSGRGVLLHVRMPPLGAGIYRLYVRSGAHRTVVPLVAAAAGRRAAVRVLVVVPALTWQGENPVDDDGSGLPETLAAGDRIDLQRPLVSGLPNDFVDVTSLLAYLDRQQRPFQLTTDVALAEGVGPRLAGHTGVILDGPMRWTPPSLFAQLQSFARAGGTVLSLGPGALGATARLTASTAGPPHAVDSDPFGAHPGAVSPVGGNLIAVIDDQLHLFGSDLAFPGFRAYGLIIPPNGVPTSLAGPANSTPTIVGLRFGRGIVVEVGLPGFAATLRGNVDSQDLVDRVWQLLHR